MNYFFIPIFLVMAMIIFVLADGYYQKNLHYDIVLDDLIYQLEQNEKLRDENKFQKELLDGFMNNSTLREQIHRQDQSNKLGML